MNLVDELASIVGDAHVYTDAETVRQNSTDATKQFHSADAIVVPADASEVAKIVAFANGQRIPIVSRGGGVGYAGGAIPVAGGIVIAMRRMNRILEIDPIDLVAVVEPGVITGDLHDAVEDKGLFYPPDPASLLKSTIGGNVAHNAGGPRAFKYGVTRQYLLGLDVVLPNGALIAIGGRSVKNATGYDLTDLICGSEGTLGVITKAILRLLPKPDETRTIMALYAGVRECADSACQLVGAGIIPSKLEFVDGQSVLALRRYVADEALEIAVDIPDSVRSLLLVEVDGDKASMDKSLASIRRVLGQMATTLIESEHGEELWELRRHLSPAVARIRPNKVNEDIVVPRSRVAEYLGAIEQLQADCGLPIVCFGHVGDGNIHVNLMMNAEDSSEVKRSQKAKRRIFELAVEMGGTISGEHGIGIMKSEFLPLALDHAAIDAMKAIKKALDPNGIMNPGKIFP